MIEVATQRSLTDAELIDRSLRQPSLFFELFDRHFRPLHRFLRARGLADAADDLAAETFVVAFRRRGGYDQSHADARPWLFGIAINLARNQARSDRRRLRVLPRLVERPTEPQLRIVDRLDAAALPLAEALAGLAVDERDALILFACEGLSYDEVSAALGVPVGTVRSRLSRARAKVRAKLDLDQTTGSNDG